MKIFELQLSNLVKYHLILEYKERGIEAMCVKEFLPLCAALLYPYKDADIQMENNNSGTIISIIESIRKHTKRVNGLSNYSIEGLRLYFQNNWLPSLTFELQVRFLKSISLIDSIERNGCFSIKGNEIVYDSFLHRISIIDISNNYGNRTFEIPENNTIPNEICDSNENVVIEDKDQATEGQEELVSLKPLKEFLLSNFPLNIYPKGLRQCDYFWEYRLNADQYDHLKSILIDLKLANHIGLLKKEICGYGTVALSVALYISEWYKRECDSLDGDKCLESLGLFSRNSLQIWNNSHLPETYLHQNKHGNKMRQIAMCALGGLPIKYVTKSPRFKDFINSLSEINYGAETTDEEIEKIIACFDDNNGVFKRSLSSGSCKEYLLELVAYLESGDKSYLPFNETDVEQPLFSEFVRQLQEGFDDELSKRFFRTEIRVWTYDFMEEGDDSRHIETEFYVHIGCGKNENRNIVTVKELSKIGVNLPQDANTFDICLKLIQNDGTSIMIEKRRTYFKIGNNCNNFCGAYGSDITTSINLFEVKEISLLIICGEYQKEIYRYSIPQYFELYSTDEFYLWTTQTNNAAKKVLFYNTSEYIPQNVDESDICFKSDEDNEWGWVYLHSIIRLQNLDNGETTDITIGSSDEILVNFRTHGLKREIALTSDGFVPTVIIEGEQGEPVPLLYYSRAQELMLTCDGLKGGELLKNHKIEFKYLRDNRYSEWTNNNRPSQGFIKLRITCRDVSKKKRTWIRMVYFIPGTNVVRRNIENNVISFEGNNICPIEDSLQGNFNPNSNKYKDSPEHGLNTSTISFRIGDEKNYVVLDVYRAFKWQQIWHNETLVKDKIGGDKPPVAIILQRNIKIRSVDENGYNEHSPNYCAYIDFFKNPKELAFYENKGVISQGLIDESSQTYQPYIYLSRYEDKSHGKIKVRMVEKNENAILLHVSDKYIDKYVFYYWSGKMEEVPVMLNCLKIEDREYQYVIPSLLQGKAVVFQSLRDSSPNMYFRPFYDDKWRWDYYVNRFDAVNPEYLLRCYDYAVEHNIYFCIFPALRILQKRDIFTEFIRTYLRKKNYHLSNNDKKNLTRLAQELVMDWFFVDRRKLFSQLDEENKKEMHKCMKGLLLFSPIEGGEHAYSKRFIDIFLQNSRAFQIRNGGIPRQFLNAIDDFREYDGYNNIERRIILLNQFIHYQNNLFKSICEILNI